MDNPENDQRLTRRVAIIGAGAAGLTAAYTLRGRGYTSMTIFESSDRVGGKCCTTMIDGKPYDLGAGILSSDNTTVLRIAKELGVSIAPVTLGRSVVIGPGSEPMPTKRTKKQLAILTKELVTYRRLLHRYAHIAQPGFTAVDPDLAVPFADFARAHHIENLAQELAHFFTGFGYDYFSRVPAAYVLKYYRWGTLKAFLQKKIFWLPQGIQHIWTAVAAHFDVRLNTTISRIDRTAESVRITTQSGVDDFDLLIIAAPLQETHTYLDVTSDEQDLFSKILTVDYCTIACSVQGFFPADGYIPQNYTVDAPNVPVFWHHRYNDTDVYTFYVFAERGQRDDVLTKNVSDFVAQFGGLVTRTHSVTHWTYFPHVSAEDVREGYYDRLDALQGMNRTYYIGELLNFSTVGSTAEYAEYLVRKML